MNETTVRCPQCKQPVPAVVEQLFDVTTDPDSKKRLLGRISNYIRCQTCGYQGPVATPIVYHDNEKELLLTYFPPELGLSANDQEKIIGPLIKTAMDRLPQEKRKAYFLRPQNFFTYQSMVENILEKDGITKQMLDEQQKQIDLLQKLLEMPQSENRIPLIQASAGIINERLFVIFERIAQGAISSGDKQAIDAVTQIQKELIENSEYGKTVSAELNEVEAAVKSLKELGNGLTREALVRLLIEAPNEARLTALINMTRGGMDQSFFDTFNAIINSYPQSDQSKLVTVRERVMELVKHFDQLMQQQVGEIEMFLDQLLESPDIEQAALGNISAFENETVMAVLEAKIREAQATNNHQKLEKLSRIFSVVQQANTPPEIDLINSLVEIADQPELLEKTIMENREKMSEEVEQFTLAMIQQIEQSESKEEQAKEILERLYTVYGKLLNVKMRGNLNSN